MIQY